MWHYYVQQQRWKQNNRLKRERERERERCSINKETNKKQKLENEGPHQTVELFEFCPSSARSQRRGLARGYWEMISLWLVWPVARTLLSYMLTADPSFARLQSLGLKTLQLSKTGQRRRPRPDFQPVCPPNNRQAVLPVFRWAHCFYRSLTATPGSPL